MKKNVGKVTVDDFAALRKEMKGLRLLLGKALEKEGEKPRWARLGAAVEETGISDKKFYAIRKSGRYPQMFGKFDGVVYVDMNFYWDVVNKERDQETVQIEQEKKLIARA